MANNKRNFTAIYQEAFKTSGEFPLHIHKDEVSIWKRRFCEEKQRHRKLFPLYRNLRLVFRWDEEASILYIKFRDWNKTTKQTRGNK